MTGITILGLVAGFFTTVALLPQVVKVLVTRRTSDLSLMMYCIMLTGISLWLIYGIIIEDLPLIIANGISVFLAAIVLGFKLKYG